MRARVAGDLASMRHCQRETDADQRMEVVAIPLKDPATCIGIDGSTGNLAVGVGKRVLVYAVCMKVVHGVEKVCAFEDMKCLLEVKFNFEVKQVALCEEYIAVTSHSQFQVVQLNLEHIPPPSRHGERIKSHETQCPLLVQPWSGRDKRAATEPSPEKSDDCSSAPVERMSDGSNTQGGSSSEVHVSRPKTGSHQSHELDIGSKEDSGLNSGSEVDSRPDSNSKEDNGLNSSSKRDSGLESSCSQMSGDSCKVSISHLFSRQAISSVDQQLTCNRSLEDHDCVTTAVITEQSLLQSAPGIITEESNSITVHKHHMTLDVGSSCDTAVSNRHQRISSTPSLEQKTVLLNSVLTAREKHTEQSKRRNMQYGIEILGPRTGHRACPVTVEYEGRY